MACTPICFLVCHWSSIWTSIVIPCVRYKVDRSKQGLLSQVAPNDLSRLKHKLYNKWVNLIILKTVNWSQRNDLDSFMPRFKPLFVGITRCHIVFLFRPHLCHDNNYSYIILKLVECRLDSQNRLFVCLLFVFFGFKVAFPVLSSQSKKNFIWYQFFRVLLLVCIRETLWGTYLMCQESHPPIRNVYKFLMDNKPIRSQEMQYSRLQMKF